MRLESPAPVRSLPVQEGILRAKSKKGKGERYPSSTQKVVREISFHSILCSALSQKTREYKTHSGVNSGKREKEIQALESFWVGAF